MANAGRGKTRRDTKRRVLRPGESIRADGNPAGIGETGQCQSGQADECF